MPQSPPALPCGPMRCHAPLGDRIDPALVNRGRRETQCGRTRSSAHRPGVRKRPLIRLRFRTRQSRRLRTQETPRQLRLLPPSSSTSICSPRSSSSAASRSRRLRPAVAGADAPSSTPAGDVRSARAARWCDPGALAAIQTSFGVAESLQHQRAERRHARAHPGIEMRLRLLPARSASAVPPAPDAPEPRPCVRESVARVDPAAARAASASWRSDCSRVDVLQAGPAGHRSFGPVRPLALQAALQLAPALQSLTNLGEAAHLKPIARLAAAPDRLRFPAGQPLQPERRHRSTWRAMPALSAICAARRSYPDLVPWPPWRRPSETPARRSGRSRQDRPKQQQRERSGRPALFKRKSTSFPIIVWHF